MKKENEKNGKMPLNSKFYKNKTKQAYGADDTMFILK